mmetsp:Transcript_77069/g.223658  ORF Transcript_77069/g.223658 Transcript_77069/m.223658 type:complete len:287 (+) Transcript_77069:1974-2834(+)
MLDAGLDLDGDLLVPDILDQGEISVVRLPLAAHPVARPDHLLLVGVRDGGLEHQGHLSDRHHADRPRGDPADTFDEIADICLTEGLDVDVAPQVIGEEGGEDGDSEALGEPLARLRHQGDAKLVLGAEGPAAPDLRVRGRGHDVGAPALPSSPRGRGAHARGSGRRSVLDAALVHVPVALLEAVEEGRAEDAPGADFGASAREVRGDLVELALLRRALQLAPQLRLTLGRGVHALVVDEALDHLVVILAAASSCLLRLLLEELRDVELGRLRRTRAISGCWPLLAR